jgi:hypothetical protein
MEESRTWPGTAGIPGAHWHYVVYFLCCGRTRLRII